MSATTAAACLKPRPPILLIETTPPEGKTRKNRLDESPDGLHRAATLPLFVESHETTLMCARPWVPTVLLAPCVSDSRTWRKALFAAQHDSEWTMLHPQVRRLGEEKEFWDHANTRRRKDFGDATALARQSNYGETRNRRSEATCSNSGFSQSG
ncbi:hypothetical protein [Novosphingobium sp. BL-52-GroH]|uniref:hypothetical protein n=1 Tax=Novosphingobium sp. BL-52-GroH TaxID=3349877 RepID=UPI00384E0C44